MKWSHRLLALLAVVVLLGGAAWVYRDWPASAQPERPGDRNLMDERDRARELDKRRQYVLWRNQQQAKVVQDLAAGRCTLLEAAARFRALFRGDEVVDRALRDTYPAPTDEERLCRWVIGYTATDQEDKPGGPALVERLEKEIREHLERGTLKIPE
jgi:hypothetical protein